MGQVILPGSLFIEQPALQLIYDTAPIGLAFLSPDCRYMQINQRLTEICGMSVEDHLGRTVRECVPALADSVEAIVRSIMETGQPVTGIEVAGQRPGENEHRAWVTYWHPMRGAGGTIVGVNVAAEEITERKYAEANLRESEQQFHSLSDSIPQLVWMADGGGRIFWVNNRWYEYTGQSRDDGDAKDWLALLDPALLPEMRLRWAEALREGSPLELELSLRGRTGNYRPFLTRLLPLQDEAAKAYRWIGTHVEISEQKRREEHIQIIVNELSHRTKNLLTVVMAIANQTARYADSVAQYHESFLDRLNALAHCHDLLVKDSPQGASFHDLVMSQMRPFCDRNSGRINVAGPLVILEPDAVQNLGLAFHELATNASKHGALSGPCGDVLIHWHVDPVSDRIRVQWREIDGPPVTPPLRRGFGHVVIEKIVPRALNGSGTLEFASAGVSWTFEFPNRNP